MVDGDGQIWAGLIDGKIVRIAPDGGEPVVVADIDGRPLGLHVARDGRLLVCSSPGGLLVLDPATGTVETLVDEVDGRGLQFCSNVTELADGTIYFTESTSAFTYEHFLGPIFEARNRGSLFRRDPDGTVLTVVAGSVLRQRHHADSRRVSAGVRRNSGAATVEVLAHRRQSGNGDAAGGQPSRQPGQPVDRCRRPDLVRDGVADQRGRGVDAEGPRRALRKLLWRLPDRLQPEDQAARLGGRFRPRHRRARRRVAHRAPPVRLGDRVWWKPAASCGWDASARRPSRTSTWPRPPCAERALDRRFACLFSHFFCKTWIWAWTRYAQRVTFETSITPVTARLLGNPPANT